MDFDERHDFLFSSVEVILIIIDKCGDAAAEEEEEEEEVKVRMSADWQALELISAWDWR